jgi:hypothetical protein
MVAVLSSLPCVEAVVGIKGAISGCPLIFGIFEEEERTMTHHVHHKIKIICNSSACRHYFCRLKMPLLETDTTVTISCPPSKGDEWKSFQFNFEAFEYLCSDDPDESSVTRGEYILSPQFVCKGHTWNLVIYPKHNFDQQTTDHRWNRDASN